MAPTKESRPERLRFLRERKSFFDRMESLFESGPNLLFDLADELRELDRRHGEPILELSRWSEIALTRVGRDRRALCWRPDELRLRHWIDFLEAKKQNQIEIADLEAMGVFSDDYHTLTYRGERMRFNDRQRKTMELLATGRLISETTIAEAVGSFAKKFRLIDVFRIKGKYHPVWRYITKVCKGGTPEYPVAHYRLDLPVANP